MTSPWVTWPAFTKFGTLGIFAALLVLSKQREELFSNNLFDMEPPEKYAETITCSERSLTARTEDGTCNIQTNPLEGSVYMRFGRNVDPNAGWAETENDTLLTPNPREVSNVLMSRGEEFKPATSLNFIAAAWIQFMTHDWFDHGPRVDEDPIVFPLPENDPLGSGTMSVRRTQPDPTRSDAEAGKPQAFQNYNTHWWDGSQIYGSSLEQNNKIRAFEDGKLKINSDGSLPTELLSGVPITGFNENWWVGLSLMHRIFTMEHNAIAEKLKTSYPTASDQWLYDRARLVNSALMAKIHTVEWTPAILNNPVLWRALYANWWGLSGDRAKRDKFHEEFVKINQNLSELGTLLDLLGIENDLGDGDSGALEHAVAGIVGSRTTNNYGTPYTLTEEFVAVYRMHPLLRNTVDVYDVGSKAMTSSYPMEDTVDANAEDIVNNESAARLWYSFGITHPGALTLQNYPKFLRELSVPLVGDIDLATIDIIRDRERGVPRYNEFRRQIGLNPITRFEDLTSNPELLSELKRLYNNDVEMIDALVGQLAEETRPDGFGFGETAFQIFIINASRRLMVDRFYTSDYRPEIYTQEGLDWVEENTMVDILRRHNPELTTVLTGMDNAFQPWELRITEDYQSWPAASKQQHLWVNGAMRTQYAADALPPLKPVNTAGLINSILWKKVNLVGDVTPENYDKPIHARGAMAKIAFSASEDTPYTGLFEGADAGLLRLSVTADPEGEKFTPGLALKLFVDGQPSQNISALYTLTGQDANHDIFANEMSNYVLPEADSLGSIILFSLVSSKPTLVVADAMSSVDQHGGEVVNSKAPTQIYFVPTDEVKGLFETTPHDFRSDLLGLELGTKVYDVYATDMEIKKSIFPARALQYAQERRDSAIKIGEISLSSEFSVSEFGDSGIFFKHQRFEDR
ncbi:hypothetical protein TDB9533_03664 [Thalassocella blandensis]|nr:hypothetical protein TDB9533_03664 [Thalassocella blandensis]